MPGKSKFAVNGSLDQLRDVIDKAGIHLKSPEKKVVSEIPPIAASAPAFPVSPSEATDEEVFREGMNGVLRASWRHNPHSSFKPAAVISGDLELQERKIMQAALDGNAPTLSMDHPEYIEGWIGVSGKRFLPKLRNGLYSIQGQIDLHGLNRAEAQIAVEDYIIRMSRYGSCCVKIIHGRGINSPTDRATLKEHLQRFLSTRKMSHYVVAYASAPFNDGGVGAVYVLLSRH